MTLGLSMIALLLVGAVEPASTGTPAAADTTQAAVSGTAEAASSGKACYVKHIAQKDQPAFDFEVIVPSAKQALATSKGYAAVTCSGDSRKLTGFRDKMCELAALNDAVKNRTIEVLGVDPREMCAAAKQVIAAESAQ